MKTLEISVSLNMFQLCRERSSTKITKSEFFLLLVSKIGIFGFVIVWARLVKRQFGRLSLLPFSDLDFTFTDSTSVPLRSAVTYRSQIKML